MVLHTLLIAASTANSGWEKVGTGLGLIAICYGGYKWWQNSTRTDKQSDHTNASGSSRATGAPAENAARPQPRPRPRPVATEQSSAAGDRVTQDRADHTVTQVGLAHVAQAASLSAAPVGSATDDGAEPSIAAELERLATLHQRGVLDDDEFRAAKAKVMKSS